MLPPKLPLCVPGLQGASADSDGRQIAENPHFCGLSGLSGMVPDTRLVAMGGIEPPTSGL